MHTGLNPLTISEANGVIVQMRDLDAEEEMMIAHFVNDGCSCQLGPNNSPCCQLFSADHYRELRCWCSEMTRGEKDLVIKAQVMALTDTSTSTRHSLEHRHQHQERQKQHASYLHQGRRVCRPTFLFLHGIGKSAFKAIKKSFGEEGLTPRVHGNTKRAPHNALGYDDTKNVISFLNSYAEDNAIQLPGRIPGYKRTDLKLLPCSTTRRSVWVQYRSSTTMMPNIRAVAYTTFCYLWRSLTPNILPTRPMTDLCALCHKNAGLIMRTSNLSEAEKSEVCIVN